MITIGEKKNLALEQYSIMFLPLQLASLILFLINAILAYVSLWVVAFNMGKGLAFLCALATVTVSITSVLWQNSNYQIFALIFQVIVGMLLMVKFLISKVKVESYGTGRMNINGLRSGYQAQPKTLTNAKGRITNSLGFRNNTNRKNWT